MADAQDGTWVASQSAVYERVLVPVLFAPYAEVLAARVAALAPRRVLEVAAGTGALTRQLLAALPAAEIVATDLNQAMVDEGARLAPGAVWRQADAMALPFPPASFDVVACAFGAMFLPDLVAGLGALGRVVGPGGHLLATTWGPLATNEVDGATVEAAAQLLPEDPPSFLARTPHGLHDPDALAGAAEAAGLADVAVERIALSSVAVPADVARGLCTGSPMAVELAARGDAAALTDAICARVAELLGGEARALAMDALLLTAGGR